MRSPDSSPDNLSENQPASYVEDGVATWEQVYSTDADLTGDATLQGAGGRVRDLRLLVRWAVMSLSATRSDASIVRSVEASLDASRVVRLTLATPAVSDAPGVKVDERGRLIIDTDSIRTVTLSTAEGDLDIRATASGIEWGVRRHQLIAPLAEWGAEEENEWVVAGLLDASLTPGPLGAVRGAALMHRFASPRQTGGVVSDASAPAARWAAALTPSQRALAIDTCRAELSILAGLLDVLLYGDDMTDEAPSTALLTASRDRALLESFIELMELIGAWPGDSEGLADLLAALDELGEEAVRRLQPLARTDDVLLLHAATFDPMAWWVQLATAEGADAEE